MGGDRSSHGTLEGRRLGDFHILERIGEGAFGVVHRARQELLDREAVVKVLHGQHRASGEVIQRFLREARLASRLDHPFAAHIYAFGAEPDGLLWLAMERVRGTPLSQLLQLRGPLPLDQLSALLSRLAEVIQAAHDQGIIHRDIKPANVMVLSRAGRLSPKLLDFGIAKLIDAAPAAVPESSAPTGNDDARLTHGGARVGSPAYMAPEVWADATRADARSDQYALGVLTYEAMTGRVPFQAPSLIALAMEHARRPPPSAGPRFGAEINDTLARALAKRPEARWESVVAFAQAFVSAAGVADVPAEVPQLEESLRQQWIAEAPQPLAEAAAALEAARNLHQAADLAIRFGRLLLRYVGLVALASAARS
jgi:serine/threonine-protein kinase